MSIYLDHNATSTMHAPLIDAMLSFLQNPVGNPSSLHGDGRMARSTLARLEIEQRQLHLGQLKDLFEFRSSQIAGSDVFGQRAGRLPNKAFLALAYYDGEILPIDGLHGVDRCSAAVQRVK